MGDGVTSSAANMSWAAPAAHPDPIRRIYLDQNAWIQLARQKLGKSHDPQMGDVLRLIQQHASSGTSSFPLSASHYFETLKRGDPAARRRLGEFMFSIAGLDRITDGRRLLVGELHAALSADFDLPPPPTVEPFGRGVAHAFREMGDPYSTPGIRAAVEALGRRQVEELIELEMLAGPQFQLPGLGIARPDETDSQRQLDYERGTRDRLRAANGDSDLARRVVLGQELQDLLDPLNAFADAHRLSLERYRTQETLTRLLLSLPAKGTITRMRWTAHQNPHYKWAIGDLSDIVALGTAAAYCDIVIAEKHWGSVLQRHQPHLRGHVLTSLRQLPDHL